MPTTTNLALPYPGLTDAPNGPSAVQALAQAVDVLPGGLKAGNNMGTPASVAGNGTPSVGTTETRDAVLGNYGPFTAVTGRRYEVKLNNMLSNGTVAGDMFIINVRNGGASTPTAASPLAATGSVYIAAAGGLGRTSAQVLGSFVPGAGTVTLGVFVVRAVGTGVYTPISANVNRELYAVDVGPA